MGHGLDSGIHFRFNLEKLREKKAKQFVRACPFPNRVIPMIGQRGRLIYAIFSVIGTSGLLDRRFKSNSVENQSSLNGHVLRGFKLALHCLRRMRPYYLPGTLLNYTDTIQPF